MVASNASIIGLYFVWGTNLAFLSIIRLLMNSMKLVIPFHSLYWSIHTKDESKHGTKFAFIFGMN